MISLFILRSNMRGMRYGIGTYVKQLTDSLLKNIGINIFIVNYLSDRYKEFTIVPKTSGLTELHIPSPVASLDNEKKSNKYSNRVVDFLAEFIKHDADSIFQVNYLDALPIVKHLKSRFSSLVISVIHSAQWQFAFNGNKRKFIETWTTKKEPNNLIMKMIEQEKELYEISDKIISVTAYMKDFIMRYYNIPGEKVGVVHNGIDNSIFHFPIKNNKEALKETLGFGKSEEIILYVGRLDKNKGLFFLLDAFSEVIKQFKNVRLVIAGEDSGPDKISQFLMHCTNIWGKVTFTGFVDYEQITKFYQVADIGIIPSIFDHCPYVALEMIGHNIPLIISKTEGLNEILTEDQCMYLKPLTDDEGNIRFDINEIAKAILTLLKNDKSNRSRITADYQGLIKTRFSNERMGSEMLSVLTSLNNPRMKHKHF